MNILTIAWKNIRQRSLASSLTALSVALGVMLMVAVLVVSTIVERAFNQQSIDYHLIVGPKGSDLQLVLSTVYRVTPPIENLPYDYYEVLKEDPRVEEAVPIAQGDYTEEGAFPIVGTIPRYFELPYAPDRRFLLRKDSHGLSGAWDAIIGSRVAQENGWDIGSTFRMVHGGAESDHVHDEEFTVVGILAPTGTANDKTVFVHLDGFYAIAGHETPIQEAIADYREFFGQESISPEEEARLIRQAEREAAHHHEHGDGHHHHHHHDIPDVQKEVTAIFVRTKTDTAALMLSGELKSGIQAQAVNPIIPMRRLMQDVVGNIRVVLLAMAVLIIGISGVSIFVSIYNSMADRRKDIAIMRALGARRQTVFSIILAESATLCLVGGAIGVLAGHAIVFLAAPYLEERTGLLVGRWAFHPWELVVIPGLIVLATLVGFIPGMTAYRTDVAKTLAE